MQLCILSLHITSIMYISHIIIFVKCHTMGFISSLLVGEFIISWLPLPEAIIGSPSMGLLGCCRLMSEVGGYNEGFFVAVYFIPSLLA